MCVYMYMYIYIYMCVYIHIYIYIYIHSIPSSSTIRAPASPWLAIVSASCTRRLPSGSCEQRHTEPLINKHTNMYIYIYIYIYIYGRCTIPPLTFDHPAICKTSWRVGETTALVYKYANTHENTCLCYCMLLFSVLHHPWG